MKKSALNLIKVLLPMLLLFIFSNCEIENPIPEISNVRGPDIQVSYLDYIESSADIDLKNFTETRVFFSYARNEENLSGPNANIIETSCTTSGRCAVAIPNSFEAGSIVFPPGSRVFYKWWIEYRLTGGNDAAFVEGPIASFNITRPQISCTTSGVPDRCPEGQHCVVDGYQIDPETELSPSVCRIANPTD